MNISTSEYSSGCASGWTMYLDPFSSSADQCNRSMSFHDNGRNKKVYMNEDEEMLSDASSGPPHSHQDQDSSEETRYNNTISGSEPKRGKHRKKVKEHRRKQKNFHLDDTASSPVLSFSKASHKTFLFENNIIHNNDKYSMEHDSGLSQGFSATDFQGKSVLRKHLGFLKTSMTRKAHD
ncbi:hypothetical protein ACH5RR_034954 [Cinchona calisaya]|uniref:Uncharacterized protein n=1 Tax=Cinchona calisaya TaxID=153742 RepID=A0ABD2YHS9_9GENT